MDQRASHAPFAVFNRTLNPLVRGLLRSPAHRVVSGRLVLLTVTGRKSGKRFTFPTLYELEGDQMTIPIGWPERKRWWRNLREPAEVEVRLRGAARSGTAVAHDTPSGGVKVVVDLV